MRPSSTSSLFFTLAAGLALVLTGCTGGGGDGEAEEPAATVGEVIATLGFEVEGFHSYVVLPGLRYDFTVSSPRDRMSLTAASEAGVSDRAGEGTRFVTVRWNLDSVPGEASLVMTPEAETPVNLTLVVDGQEREIGDLRTLENRGAYVVVPEGADDFRLEIEYDGQVQTLDPFDRVTNRPSEIPALYVDSPALNSLPCPGKRLDEVNGFFYPGAECNAQIGDPVPYVGDVGWASPGKAWLVARLAFRGAEGGGFDDPDGYVGYDVEGGEVALQVDGAGPVEILPFDSLDDDPAGLQDDGRWVGRAIFEVDESAGQGLSVDFRRDYRAEAEDTEEAVGAGRTTQFEIVHRGKLQLP